MLLKVAESGTIDAFFRHFKPICSLFLTDLTVIVLNYYCIFSFYFYFILTALCKALLSTGWGGGALGSLWWHDIWYDMIWYGIWYMIWQLELQNVRSSSQIIIINKPTTKLLQAGCPSWRSPNEQCKWSKERKNITFQGLVHPKLTRGLSTLSLTTKDCWSPRGRIIMLLISPLMPVP